MESLYEKVKLKELKMEEAIDDFLHDPCLSYDFYDESVSSDRPIDLDDFFEILDRERWGSFAGTKVNKTRYLLLKLDFLMANAATIMQYNKDSSSIEHLMPQNIKNTSWSVDDDSHKEWIHRIGNLVLIDKNKNSSLSNKLYHEKKLSYQGAIETRANTNYILMNNMEWNVDSIRQNHNRVIQILKRYYLGNSLQTFLDLKKNIASFQITLN